MLKPSRWIAVTALAAVVLASPLAAEAATHRPESRSPITVIENWLAPLLRLLGGTTVGNVPSSSDPGGNETDAGPRSDPDGLTVGSEADGGPHSDPDGLTVGGAGPHSDPNGLSVGKQTGAGPQSDPNGLTLTGETDAGPQSDPDGLMLGNERNAGPESDPNG